MATATVVQKTPKDIGDFLLRVYYDYCNDNGTEFASMSVTDEDIKHISKLKTISSTILKNINAYINTPKSKNSLYKDFQSTLITSEKRIVITKKIPEVTFTQAYITIKKTM